MTNYSKKYKWGSMSSQIIVQLCEDSLTFKNFKSWYFIQTASKTKQNDISRIALIIWRSKNLGSTKIDWYLLKKKGGMPTGASPSLDAWEFLEYYLGVSWASPSLGSCHSLFHSPSNLYPKLENFTTQNLTKNS